MLAAPEHPFRFSYCTHCGHRVSACPCPIFHAPEIFPPCALTMLWTPKGAGIDHTRTNPFEGQHGPHMTIIDEVSSAPPNA
jgi:hypothetical protein